MSLNYYNIHLEQKEKYIALENKHQQDYKQLKNQSLAVSIIRFFIIVSAGVLFYFYAKTDETLYVIFASIAIVIFLILIKIHEKITTKQNLKEALVTINKDELNFINHNQLNFDGASTYINHAHPYAYDLDIFGENSIFQTLNRTATHIGHNTLANSLLAMATGKEISKNQEAIKELTDDIEWRQLIFAHAKMTKDSKEIHHKLISWSGKKAGKVSMLLSIISFASPLTYISALVMSFISSNPIFGDIAVFLFLFNLAVLGSQLKKIKKELIETTKINNILKNYSSIIKLIEQKEFTAEKINELKNKLKNDKLLASEQIHKLSNLFGQLESISNPIGAGIFNGIFLYHIHTLRNLYKWKANSKIKIKEWLQVIGEIEMLNSLANFSFNHPDFNYPKLNTEYKIKFENLGHPLIKSTTRVNNTVDFSRQNFIILTGSNMAGKSTFLRSLGVNMVLAGTGSPICCTEANIHPLNIYVSMRLSDSLNDNESYFFAEVKRLKEIMKNADKSISFVLLDEILRGTNSDDKRTGTVEVIKKIIAKNAIGAIATHDLKVCDISDQYPDTLTNKCFEVEIIDNELSFDYKLREGICKNKSATFLMKKMNVI